jgi:hypothetical protein
MLLARRVASGAVIWIGGSCDPCGWIAAAVCACAAVPQAAAPSAATLTESKAALRPATAETFRLQYLSSVWSTELTVAIERNDLDAFLCPIPTRAPNQIQIRSCDFICIER